MQNLNQKKKMTGRKSKGKGPVNNPYIKFFLKYRKDHPQLPVTIAAQEAGSIWKTKKRSTLREEMRRTR